MQFGRVDGHLIWENEAGRDHLRLTVVLETTAGLRIARDERVEAGSVTAEPADLSWLADQYTQETIAVDLAVDGWEVVSAGNVPAVERGEVSRSATYTVRRPIR